MNNTKRIISALALSTTAFLTHASFDEEALHNKEIYIEYAKISATSVSCRLAHDDGIKKETTRWRKTTDVKMREDPFGACASYRNRKKFSEKHRINLDIDRSLTLIPVDKK